MKMCERFFLLSIIFLHSKGRRDSDIRPKMRSELDLPPGKKGFYMDDAITKTSKW